MPVLSINDVSIFFGGLEAVSHLDMILEKGELIGLIGPNGAGKTTVFNMLTGVYKPSKGSILLEVDGKQQNIDGLKPYTICSLGVARTFQNIRLFKDLSVKDNVLIGMHKNIKSNLFNSIFHSNRYTSEEGRILSETLEILKIFNLYDKQNELARNLSYGEQRHLEIARALATNPSVLLLDEPAAGMNPAETAELTKMISWLREKFGLTVLLIEHDMSLVMKVCERIYVLDYGVEIANGTPDEIKSNKRVIKAYLGEATGDVSD